MKTPLVFLLPPSMKIPRKLIASLTSAALICLLVVGSVYLVNGSLTGTREEILGNIARHIGAMRLSDDQDINVTAGFRG